MCEVPASISVVALPSSPTAAVRRFLSMAAMVLPAFALAQSRYKTGLSTQIEVLTAEATLLSARQQMAALIAQSATQRITLLLCVGGGFEPPREVANASE